MIIKAWNFATDSRTEDKPRGICRHCGDRCGKWRCVRCQHGDVDCECHACHDERAHGIIDGRQHVARPARTY